MAALEINLIKKLDNSYLVFISLLASAIALIHKKIKMGFTITPPILQKLFT